MVLFLCMICRSRTFLSLTLGAVALTGDFLVRVLRNDVARAISDNVTHGMIGFLSWFIVAEYLDLKHRLLEAFLCAFFASVIDADHFISAQSLHLKDAVKLSSRPFMHCTTLTVFGGFLILLLANLFPIYCVTHSNLQRITWIFIVASLSHHIRDANRRGLWLWPLPFWPTVFTYSTPPIPKILYISLSIAIPNILQFLLFNGNKMLASHKENVSIV